jgi:hypothetical protein
MVSAQTVLRHESVLIPRAMHSVDSHAFTSRTSTNDRNNRFETITDDHPTRKLTGGVGGGEDDGPMIEQNQNPLGQGQQMQKAVADDTQGDKKQKKKKKKKKAKKDSDSEEDEEDTSRSQRGRGRTAQKSASLRSLLQSGVAPQEYVC